MCPLVGQDSRNAEPATRHARVMQYIAARVAKLEPLRNNSGEGGKERSTQKLVIAEQSRNDEGDGTR